MIGTFELGETVICKASVYDKPESDPTRILVDPSTSIKVSIIRPKGSNIVSNQAMVKDSVGLYHYDFNSATTNEVGVYTVYYTAIDGTRITVQKDTFQLGV
jgi:hypothetical protein